MGPSSDFHAPVMREIVSVHVGGGGVRLGVDWWDAVAREQGPFNEAGEAASSGGAGGAGGPVSAPALKSEDVEVFFDPLESGGYRPRAVMVDLARDALQETLETAASFRSVWARNQVFPTYHSDSSDGCGNNWARGRYTEGAEIEDASMDAIRAQLEACDGASGVQLTHTLCGGTGSGHSVALLEGLRAYDAKLTLMTHTVLPSMEVTDTVVQPYSVMLSTPALLECADAVAVYDLEAVLHTAKASNLGPSRRDLDLLIAAGMVGNTTTLRYRSQCHANRDVRRLARDMTPYPKLHFLSASISPCVFGIAMAKKFDVKQLAERLFDDGTQLSVTSPGPFAQSLRDGTLFAGVGSFRASARMAWGEADRCHSATLRAYEDVARGTQGELPYTLHAEVVTSVQAPLAPRATFLGNHTGVYRSFERLQGRAERMWRRKAFMMWYTGEGMDGMEFTESMEALENVIDDYRQWHFPGAVGDVGLGHGSATASSTPQAAAKAGASAGPAGRMSLRERVAAGRARHSGAAHGGAGAADPPRRRACAWTVTADATAATARAEGVGEQFNAAEGTIVHDDTADAASAAERCRPWSELVLARRRTGGLLVM